MTVSDWELSSCPVVKSVPATLSLWHPWERESIFCLCFVLFPSGTLACRLIKLSLTGKTHCTPKINTHLFVIFLSLCWSMCFDDLSVSLYYEGKWWGVSYYTPLAGIGFYFLEEFPHSVKTLIKNLQWVVKGFECAAAAVIFPPRTFMSKQQHSLTGELQTFIVHLCTLRLRLAAVTHWFLV